MPPSAGCLLQQVNSATASCGTAAAGHFFHFRIEVVIHRKLLALFDVAKAEIDDVAFDDPGLTVGLAAVIDVFSAAPADSAIEGPVSVQREEVVELALFAPPLGLLAADTLADVFDDLAIFGIGFSAYSPQR